ncbi:YhcN/YlaJ family sporulation lipoprotein [Aneurinibacillus sp. BA2021]|nr:YhcN/YlaJ family sporulation lipoprotein [Aneurinibacillus sp. BA2021]
MHIRYQAGIMIWLGLLLTGTLTACGSRAGTDSGANTQSQTYRVNQYGTNGTTVSENFGIRPYGTQPYGIRPDMASTYPYPPGPSNSSNLSSVNPPAQLNSAQDRKKAEQMARVAAKVSGVTRATAIVHGREAVIGIEGATAPDQKMLERNVQQALKRAEPGYNLHVTADKALIQRIRTLSTRIGGTGTSVLHTAEPDFAGLVRDIGRSITAPFR